MLQSSLPQRIAIIGGGFSGAMVAAQLLRQATHPLQIKLIEPRTAVGRGVAYSTVFDCHLLNVPAGKMSAFPELPDHFLNWLKSRPNLDELLSEPLTPGTFVPRRVYGVYIQAVLAEAQKHAAPGVELECLQDEAEAICPSPEGAVVYLKNGQVLSEILAVNQVVLALGNFPPSDPPVLDRSFYQSARYISNPWATQALRSIDPAQPVLLVGSGLTMLDWAVGLHQQGFRSKIHVVSRHGLLPQPHQTGQPYQLATTERTFTPTVRSLLQWVRQEVEIAQQQGCDWRAVIDAIRPYTQVLWRSLPLAERRRFLRHARPYWEIHRHRVAPKVAETIDQMVQSGQLQIQAGRIHHYREHEQGVEVFVRPRHEAQLRSIQVATVVNCTGSECNYRKFRLYLIESLLKEGLVQPDPLNLGLETADNGALIRADGAASEWLFTIGSARKANLWETTAVPELRQQAAGLAKVLLQPPDYQLSVSDSYQISKSKSFRYSSAL